MTRPRSKGPQSHDCRAGRRFFLPGVAALVGSFLLAAAGFAQPSQGASPSGDAARCRTDYRIEARLDGETKGIRGQLELDWHNASSDSVGDLWFHLYLNAFSNNRSTHLVESGGKLRDHEATSGWGWSRVTSIVAVYPNGDREDLFTTMRYRRPDDGRAEDRTVFSVDLPRAVPPGESLTVEVGWEAQLPRVRRRTGYKDDFLLVAQWFPKLGVYESGRGWNCHQFHMNTEFYADYGTYDVSLDLPREYEGKVFGSGVRVMNEIVGDRLHARFSAPSLLDRERTDAFGKSPLVHDFTWTADPRFVVENRIFRFADYAERFPNEVEKAKALLGPGVDLTLRNVDVTILVHPEHASQIERHFEATCAALFFYGLWFGEYPYQHITVIDPPYGGEGAGGMEYPTLFTAGTRLFTTEDMHRPESVTVHECGHQFWFGLVGNNEFENAWMDEGFNSYTDSEVLWRVYGAQRGTTDFARIPVEGVRVAGLPGGGKLADVLVGKSVTIPLPLVEGIEIQPLPESGFLDLWRDQPALTFVPEWTDPRWGDRLGYLRDPATDPIVTPGWEYADRMSYRTNSYPRPAVALRSLAAVVGQGAFLRGMRHYAREWRYRHPYPEDFFHSFQEGAGVNVDWYFRALFQGRGTVDWQLEVEQGRRPDPAGFFQSEGGEFFEQPAEEERSGDPAPWQVSVLVRSEGELVLPVPIRLTFEDGTTEEFLWTREEQAKRGWIRIERDSQKKLVRAEVDPERSYYLDTDMSNNAWYDETDDLAPWRWGERVLAQYQHFFHWIGGLGG